MFAADGCTLVAFGRIGGSPYDTGKYSLSSGRLGNNADPFAVQCSAILSNNLSMSPDSPP
jgi:hypothetical protein